MNKITLNLCNKKYLKEIVCCTWYVYNSITMPFLILQNRRQCLKKSFVFKLEVYGVDIELYGRGSVDILPKKDKKLHFKNNDQ